VVQRPDFHSVIDYLSNYRISESLATYDTKLVMPRTVVPPLRDRTSESIKKKTVSVAWNGKEPSLYSFKEPTIQVLTRKRTTDCFALRAPRTRADYNAENGAQVTFTDHMCDSEDRTLQFARGQPRHFWLVGGASDDDQAPKPQCIDLTASGGEPTDETSGTFYVHARPGGSCSFSKSPVASDPGEVESGVSDSESASD